MNSRHCRQRPRNVENRTERKRAKQVKFLIAFLEKRLGKGTWPVACFIALGLVLAPVTLSLLQKEEVYDIVFLVC